MERLTLEKLRILLAHPGEPCIPYIRGGCVWCPLEKEDYRVCSNFHRRDIVLQQWLTDNSIEVYNV